MHRHTMQDVMLWWDVSSLGPVGGRGCHSTLSWSCSVANLHEYFLVLESRQPQLWSVLSLSSFLQRVLTFAHGPKETLGHSTQPSFLQGDVPSILGLTVLLALACPCQMPCSWRKGKVRDWMRSPSVRTSEHFEVTSSGADYFLGWELPVVCALWQWKIKMWWEKGGH